MKYVINISENKVKQVNTLFENAGVDPTTLDPEFVKAIAIDPLMTAVIGKPALDIVQFDINLSVIDPDYDPSDCTWLGKRVSMRSYVMEKYGKKHVDAVEKIIHSMAP